MIDDWCRLTFLTDFGVNAYISLPEWRQSICMLQYQCERIRDGILEVGEDELIHHVKGNKYVWSYNCLRRYGVGEWNALNSSSGLKIYT